VLDWVARPICQHVKQADLVDVCIDEVELSASQAHSKDRGECTRMRNEFESGVSGTKSLIAGRFR